MMCPNAKCSYRGDCKRKAKGSGIVFVILVLLCFPLALIYGFLKSGYDYFCPRCGCLTRG